MPIHLPSNQSVGEGELRKKRLGKETGLEPRMEHTMRQVESQVSNTKHRTTSQTTELHIRSLKIIKFNFKSA